MNYYPLVTALQMRTEAATQRREVCVDTLPDGTVFCTILPATAPAAHRALVIYVRSPDGDHKAVLLEGPRYGAGVYSVDATHIDGPVPAWVYTVTRCGREVKRALDLAVPDPPAVRRSV